MLLPLGKVTGLLSNILEVWVRKGFQLPTPLANQELDGSKISLVHRSVLPKYVPVRGSQPRDLQLGRGSQPYRANATKCARELCSAHQRFPLCRDGLAARSQVLTAGLLRLSRRHWR